MKFEVPKDNEWRVLTYANEDDPWLRKWLIERLEYATGRRMLEEHYNDIMAKPVTAVTLWERMVEKMRVTLDYSQEQLDKVPKQGPVVFISNHPFGVVDGILICYLATRVRHEYSIVINEVLYINEVVAPHFLPIDFGTDKEAMKTNINTRNESIRLLKEGQAVIIFPSGAVASSKTWFGPAEEWEWKRFVLKMVTKSKATVIPLFFHGQNSRFFQIASKIHSSLRLGFLLNEVKNKFDKTIKIEIGDPITPETIQAIDRNDLLDYLRNTTLNLGKKD